MPDQTAESASGLEPPAAEQLGRYEAALRALLAEIDYDLYKAYDRPEDEDDPTGFPELAEKFARLMRTGR